MFLCLFSVQTTRHFHNTVTRFYCKYCAAFSLFLYCLLVSCLCLILLSFLVCSVGNCRQYLKFDEQVTVDCLMMIWPANLLAIISKPEHRQLTMHPAAAAVMGPFKDQNQDHLYYNYSDLTSVYSGFTCIQIEITSVSLHWSLTWIRENNRKKCQPKVPRPTE